MDTLWKYKHDDIKTWKYTGYHISYKVGDKTSKFIWHENPEFAYKHRYIINGKVKGCKKKQVA